MAAFGENKEDLKFFYLCQKFDLNLNELTQEWRSLEYSFSKNEIKSFEKIGIVQFWCKIVQAKNFNDNFIFPNLSKLVKKLFALPHANADAERIFSVVTDVRTKKRNKLSHDNLNSICIIRSFLQNEEIDCKDFKCNQNHFEKFNSNVLYT